MGYISLILMMVGSFFSGKATTTTIQPQSDPFLIAWGRRVATIPVLAVLFFAAQASSVILGGNPPTITPPPVSDYRMIPFEALVVISAVLNLAALTIYGWAVSHSVGRGEVTTFAGCTPVFMIPIGLLLMGHELYGPSIDTILAGIAIAVPIVTWRSLARSGRNLHNITHRWKVVFASLLWSVTATVDWIGIQHSDVFTWVVVVNVVALMLGAPVAYWRWTKIDETPWPGQTRLIKLCITAGVTDLTYAAAMNAFSPISVVAWKRLMMFVGVRESSRGIEF